MPYSPHSVAHFDQSAAQLGDALSDDVAALIEIRARRDEGDRIGALVELTMRLIATGHIPPSGGVAASLLVLAVERLADAKMAESTP